jgi:hypothetical protein
MRRLALLLVLAGFLGCSEDEPNGDQPGGAGGTAGNGGGGTGGAGGAGGSGGGTAGESGTAGAGGAAGEPVIVAVGYGGRRMRSLDLGVQWGDLVEDDPDGGDDENLLRAATFADGLFVAVGWRILTSVDGVSWDDHSVDGQQLCGGVAHGNGVFVCVGGCGNSYRSSDGLAWSEGGNATEGLGCAHMRSLAFGNGVFVAAGDQGRVSTTGDGVDWSAPADEDVSRVVFRDGEFIAQGEGLYKTSTDGVSWTEHDGEADVADQGLGVWLRGEWKGKIDRSTDGVAYDRVFDDEGNHLQAFAFGLVVPP